MPGEAVSKSPGPRGWDGIYLCAWDILTSASHLKPSFLSSYRSIGQHTPPRHISTNTLLKKILPRNIKRKNISTMASLQTNLLIQRLRKSSTETETVTPTGLFTALLRTLYYHLTGHTIPHRRSSKRCYGLRAALRRIRTKPIVEYERIKAVETAERRQAKDLKRQQSRGKKFQQRREIEGGMTTIGYGVDCWGKREDEREDEMEDVEEEVEISGNGWVIERTVEVTVESREMTEEERRERESWSETEFGW